MPKTQERATVLALSAQLLAVASTQIVSGGNMAVPPD